MKIYPHEILRFFDSIPYPVSMKQAEILLKLIELDRYDKIIDDYGATHVLIILEFFEKLEEYSTCGEILRQIEIYNKGAEKEIKTKFVNEGGL